MTKSDITVIVIGVAILVVGAFVIFNRTSDEPAVSDTTTNNSSISLNPNDVTAPIVSTNENSSAITSGQSTSVTSPTATHQDNVSLAQVPYTGIGSNTKVFLFMLALAIWAGGLSFFIVRRKALAELR